MAVLTVRELEALEQQLDREMILAERSKACAAAAEDPQIRTRLEQAAACHRRHFGRLLSLLD